MAQFFLNRNNVFNSVPSNSGGTGFFTDLFVSGTTTTNNLIVQNSASIKNLEVTGDEVVDGNLSVNGNAVIPDLTVVTISGISPSSLIVFRNLFSFSNQIHYRQLMRNSFVMIGPVPGAVTGMSTTSGTLGSFNPVNATFTPDVVGLYSVSLNVVNLNVSAVPTSSGGSPSFNASIFFNGSTNAGSSQSIFVPNVSVSGQLFGISVVWEGRLTLSDTITLAAGIYRNLLDGTNVCNVYACIKYLG